MGYDVQKKKNHPVLIALLWVCFLAAIGIVAYLSFQNVEKYQKIGKQFIQYIAEQKYADRPATEEEIRILTYEVRQTGRVAAFFLLGIMGTITIYLSFKKCNWILKTGIAAVILIAVACLTEKLKVYFPGRHYSYDEMILSITAVCMGFLLVSVISLCFRILKSFFRVITTTIH